MIKSFINKYDIDKYYYVDDIFVFTNEDNNYSFLLSKNGCSIIVDDNLLDEIKNNNISDDLKFKMFQHGLLKHKFDNIPISDDKNDNIYFIIDTTKKCNFDCLYCFRNLDDNRVISDERLEDICKYILNIANERKLKRVSVQIWGGEPVLAIDKLEYVYNFFKNTDVLLKIDVETNGSLITKNIAKRLYDMRVNVGVSLDGNKKHQDIQRRLLNGKSSIELVKKGIKNLQEYYKDNLSGITVITKYNYKDITDIINFFVNELKMPNMKFNIVKDNPNANEEGIGLSLNEVREFANKLFDTVELYNLMGLKFNEGNISTRASNLIEKNNNSYCISNGCKGGKNIISIDMNGDIYPCEMMDYKNVKLGSIYNGTKLGSNIDLLNQIKKVEKDNIYFKKKINDECESCPWHYYCQGGCTSRIIYSNGKMKYDEVECEFNKIIYEKIINQILKNIDLGGK